MLSIYAQTVVDQIQQRVGKVTRDSKLPLTLVLAAMITACGGGGGSDSGSIVSPGTPTPTPEVTTTPSPTVTPTVTATPTPTPTPVASERVSISGQVTFDSIPHTIVGGLDYDRTFVSAVRGATVQAVNGVGTVLSETVTDVEGNYQLSVDAEIDMRIRVLAALEQRGNVGPTWDFRVTDNTSGNALYSMRGAISTSGSEDSTRNLHAASGWDGTAYTGTRVAAPFAILDAVYEALQVVLEAAPSTNFESAELRWSVNNTPVSGNLAEGLIGTSFYRPSENNMYILGDADNDTDEYDKSVIQHEWGHYLEDTLSRSDSIGGRHVLNGAYDLRLAFGEGFANAFSGIASGQVFYADSSGLSQARGFQYSLENNIFRNPGWFNENSVGKIIFDIADSASDGADNLSLGFGPIFRALASPEYTSSSSLTSIFLFIDTLKNMSNASTQEAIDAIVQSEFIFGEGPYGIGETNDSPSNASFVLPVFNEISLGQTINLCGNNRDGEFNGLDVRRFVRVNLPQQGNYRLTASKTLGTGNRDPDIVIRRNGQFFNILSSGVVDFESGVVALNSGEHILEVFDFLNTDNEDGGGSSCFDVTISAQ